jgi:hypothetical protein
VDAGPPHTGRFIPSVEAAQALGGPTRLDQARPGSTRLDQARPGSTRLNEMAEFFFGRGASGCVFTLGADAAPREAKPALRGEPLRG